MDFVQEHAYGLLFVAAGLLLLIYSVLKMWSLISFNQNGIKTDGVIFRIEERGRVFFGSHSINDPDYRIHHKQLITVRFLTTEKEWITAEYNPDLNLSYSSQYEEGDRIKVRYNPKDPTDFILLTKQPEWLLISLSFLVALAIVAYGAWEMIKVPSSF